MRPIRLTFPRILAALALCTATASASSLTSALPASVNAGGPAFTLTVNGTGFTGSAVVKWSGAALPTTYQSPTQLTAAVGPNFIAIAGKYSIAVANGDGSSATGSLFAIVNPVLSSIAPNTLPAGTNGYSVVATGIGFSSNCAINLMASGSQSVLSTTYNSPTSLTAYVPAGALTGTYPVSISVTDPTSGATSQSLPLTLTLASVSAVQPSAVYANTFAFPLYVSGSNFAYGAKILFNNAPLATTYFNSTTLGCIVTPDLLPNPSGNPAQIGISVQNPGAGVTATIIFLVYPSQFGSTITAPLVPASAVAGGPAFTLTVNGSGFVQGSTVYWSGTALTTTYVSATQLTAIVPAGNLSATGSASIAVAAPGSNPSNSVTFLINAPAPAVSSISPTTVNAGGPAFTLTINGSGFLATSIVSAPANASTTFVSSTQLTASIPASDIATPGSIAIQVSNPGPVYSAQTTTLTIQMPPPVLSSLNPSSVVTGGPDLTLTVTGSGFASNSTVQWNSTPLTTSYLSATQLTAVVPAALTAAPGAASITVSSASGPSNTLPFTVAPRLPGTSTAGIVNAASDQPAIAPGSIFSIYGTALGASTAQATVTPLPTSLATTTVNVNGKPIPLFFVSTGQINAQLPFEIQPGTATLVIQNGTLSSAPVTFTVAATGPGVFTDGVSNPTHAVAINPDGTLNSAQAPAKPGQYITAYVTGQGAVNVPVATGAVAPTTPPYALPSAAVQASLGGQPATVQFAGLAPGFVGLLQLNLLVPTVPAGEQTLLVTIGTATSAPVTLSIAAP